MVQKRKLSSDLTGIDFGFDFGSGKVTANTDETTDVAGAGSTNVTTINNAAGATGASSADFDSDSDRYSTTAAAVVDNHHYYIHLDTNCYCYYTYFNIIDYAFESSKL